MTFRAQDTSTGQPVLLHQLLSGRTPPHQPDLAPMVFKYLPGEGAPGTEHFLEIGLVEDRVFIVTADVPECLDLRNWLQSIAISQRDRESFAGPSQGEPASNQRVAEPKPDDLQEGLPTEPPESDHEPGEFTRMFVAPGSKPKHPVSSVPKGGDSLPPPPPSAPPASQQPATKSPGEFTRMFSGKGIAGQQAVPPAPPSGPELKPEPALKPPDKRPRGQVPSGFEVVYQSRKPTPAGSPLEPPGPTSVPPPPSEPASPGEFTEMFSAMGKGQAGQPSASSPLPARAPSASSPKSPAEEAGPGEVLRLFRPPMATPEPPAVPPPSPGVTMPSPPPPASATQKKPGEFTLIFQAGAHAPSKSEPPLPGSSQRPTTPLTGPGSRGVAGAGAPGMGSPSQSSAPLPGASKKGPGDLTRIMQGYKPSTATPAAPALEPPKPSSPPPAAEPAKKGPGEFTLLFRQPPQPAAPVPPAAPPPATVQPAPPPQPHHPGEYTSIFGPSQLSPAPTPTVPQAAPPAGYGYPAVPGAPLPPPAMPQMPAYPVPPPPAAPQAVYPQVAMPPSPQFQPPPPPAYAMAPPPVPQAMPTGAKKPGKFLIPLLILGGLFLAAVVVILFFALRH